MPGQGYAHPQQRAFEKRNRSAQGRQVSRGFACQERGGLIVDDLQKAPTVVAVHAAQGHLELFAFAIKTLQHVVAQGSLRAGFDGVAGFGVDVETQYLLHKTVHAAVRQRLQARRGQRLLFLQSEGGAEGAGHAGLVHREGKGSPTLFVAQVGAAKPALALFDHARVQERPHRQR